MTRLPPRADIALAAGLGIVSMQSAFDGAGLKSPAWAVIALIELSVLPLAFRRVHPVPVFAVSIAATVAGFLAFDGFQILGPIAAVYAVARYCDRRTSAGVAAVAVTASLIPATAVDGVSPVFTAGVAVGFGLAWWLGHRVAWREAELRAAREQAARAVEMERARIARELHDVIAHNVSVMVVQAAAGRDVFDSHPASAREALAAIESVGREALGELRLLLGVVKDGDGNRPPLAPQPGLVRLPALVEQVRAAGLAVELDLQDAGGLPAAVDVSAFRIVQEALTNVIKHSRATATAIALRRSRTHLELDITDNGSGWTAREAGGGRGLVGMRERVKMLGGELTAGPRPGGGFAVRARIPVSEARP